MIYVTTHSATIAIDAKTGKQMWKTKVEYPPEMPRIVCCGIINRGAALFDGKVFRTTLDAQVHGARRQDRQGALERRRPTIKEGYSMTVAPLVADGVVITGISGARVRHPWLHRRLGSGNRRKHLWRTYTVPSPGEPGGDTWPGDTCETRRRLDLDHRLLRSGAEHRLSGASAIPARSTPPCGKGDNLYTCSVLALDPKTGKIKWHYQFSPNNPFDYDAVAEMVLADMNIEGKPTKVLMDANRNGFFYVLDRTNGKLLAANPYIARSIGRPAST